MDDDESGSGSGSGSGSDDGPVSSAEECEDYEEGSDEMSSGSDADDTGGGTYNNAVLRVRTQSCGLQLASIPQWPCRPTTHVIRTAPHATPCSARAWEVRE